MAETSRMSPEARDASAAVSELQKAIGFFRLYPTNHPLCAQSVDEALAAITQFIEGHGTLSLQIKRDGTYLGEDSVASATADSDLAYVLYPEGIRSLAFEEGVERRELFEFVCTLTGHSEDEQEAVTFQTDLLSVLWQHDFNHVRYLVYDELSPAGLESVRYDRSLAPVAARILELITDVTPPGVVFDVAARSFTQPPNEVETYLKNHPTPPLLRAAWHAQPAKVAVHLASREGATRRALRGELDDLAANDSQARANDIVSWALRNKGHEPDREDAARFLVGSAVNALWQGDVDAANELAARAEIGDTALERAVGHKLGLVENLSLFCRALQQHAAEWSEEELARRGARYLAHLDRAAVPSCCRVYKQTFDDRVRKVLRGYLGRWAELETASIAKLTEHPNPVIMSEILELFGRGGKGSAGWAQLEAYRKDASRPERMTAASALLDVLSGAKERRDLMVMVLKVGPGKIERLAALERLVVLGGAPEFEKLRSLVSASHFPERDPDEVDAVLGAMTRLGKVRAVATLQELSKRRTRLFNRKATKILVEHAKKWLTWLKGRRR